MKWAKLHLRDLFWLTIVVAVALGWGADRDHWRNRINKHAQAEARRRDYIMSEYRKLLADCQKRLNDCCK